MLRKNGIFRSAYLSNVLSGKGFEVFAALEIESAQSARWAEVLGDWHSENLGFFVVTGVAQFHGGGSLLYESI
ncbi:MAG: hypothetical protein DKT66_08980 [Candidatus Melainabacteria bacterium]|nr:MAG: hypothetical protein DKT66_08980 [Candidatus Melainabacteria bacterium]